MEGTDRRYLTKLNFQPGAAGVVGVVRGDGFAKERDDIGDLSEKLSAHPGVTVTPHKEEKGGNDGDYPWKFDLDVSWQPVKKVTAVGGQGSGPKTSKESAKK